MPTSESNSTKEPGKEGEGDQDAVTASTRNKGRERVFGRETSKPPGW